MTLKIAVSGTYGTGKTTTTIALSHLTGIPRTHAKTMREILPVALPGKRLEECTMAELVQLGVRRYAERAVAESHLADGFISDGSSIHEWVYGINRLMFGINPDDVNAGKMEITAELACFQDVMDNLGMVMKQHAKETYDIFIHLPVEFPLDLDGHRPVSEGFRRMSDYLLRETLDQYKIPYQIVGGSLSERLEKITDLLDMPRKGSIDDAIAAARAVIKGINTADETSRATA